MNCPNCGRRLTDGQMECLHCQRSAQLIHDPTPITPTTTTGGAALGFAAGVVAGLLGAFAWAWLTVALGYLFAWPALVIGVAVGLAVRVTGGTNLAVKGVLGFVCGVVGIGAGLLFMLYQVDFELERFAAVADLTNIAFVFIGLSLARSLAGGKRLIAESPELQRALSQSKKTTK